MRQPLVNPDEMANRDAAQVARKLASASYASALAKAFPTSAGDPEAALSSAGGALEAFLLSPQMAPFSSRYDDFVRGKGSLSALELEGLAIFKNREKGNCVHCHKMDDSSKDPARSLFTDYGFEVVAVPRNRAAQPAGPSHPDLGLCERKGAIKTADEERFCGAFRTPSLRNVAVRSSFMHNGVFTNLRDVLAFYATRDATPQRWYPGEPYEELPSQYQVNVNADTVPYSTVAGGVPRLNDHDIDALVAFLGTLTDAELPVAPDFENASSEGLAARR